MDTSKFCIEVTLLTGRYVATYYNRRDAAEWPPHPARLFSAMVASWADTDSPDIMERQSLEWLEMQDPPAITASDYTTRTVVSHFVPVNDTEIISRTKYKNLFDHTKLHAQERLTGTTPENLERIKKLTDDAGRTTVKSAMGLLPDHRPKQERFFPSVTPYDPHVVYAWDVQEDSPDVHVRNAMDAILARVARLGHASSLVSCRIFSDPPEPTWKPQLGLNAGNDLLRNVSSGQLKELERLYIYHEGSKLRPLPCVNTVYTKDDRTSSQMISDIPNTAGEWYVFEFERGSRVLPSTRVVDLAKTMRAAIFRYAKNIPEGLSGHKSNGSPTLNPSHVAFVPLPYVGFGHSDGRLLGIAISVPTSLDSDSRYAIIHSIAEWEKEIQPGRMKLTMGATGETNISRLRGTASLTSLRQEIWKKPSHLWVSATPIALPRHPGNLARGSMHKRVMAWAKAKSAVKDACKHVGIPKPKSVEVSLTPFITGAYAVNRFPPFIQKTGLGGSVRRQLIHAAITFERPVSGPLLIGTGRFFGLGLMRPVIPEVNHSV